MPKEAREERLRRYWDRHAGSYDRQMGFFDRHLFAGSRDWVCSRARGQVLEVAIGTGLNLAHYPGGVQLTGIEWSPAMLDIARARAGQLSLEVDLRQGDAQALDFGNACFDAVVCTFSLCAIPDDRAAVAEMARVLRPGGLLLLADHVEAAAWPGRAVQALIEVASVPAGGEHFRRRPIRHVQALGLTVEDRNRLKLGIVERLAARKPPHPAPPQREGQ
ncbi:MAG: methyltransferase domain-containing protein [Actinomycetota bacterium]|nr:methyltransferase domain-containing protein [Actinomycetota bacterium]